jgi:DNA-binding NtrC family response regulator
MENQPPTILCGFLADGSPLFDLLCQKLAQTFQLRAFNAATAAQAEHLCDVLLVPLQPDAVGQQRASTMAIKGLTSKVPTIALLRSVNSRTTAEAMEAGAFACWCASDSIEELQGIIRRASQFRSLQNALDQMSSPGSLSAQKQPIVGGTKIASLISLASRLARSDVNVLITGETGTGKEAFARLLHEAGPRANAPFIAVACSSLPETLIEAELFGHERGAFTGANASRRGRFEEVGAGTLFLDEIAELSPVVQVKLLRVLQERAFERLGSSRPIRCHARIVFATHQSLRALAAEGKFRLDLYYRLSGAQIHLPPLRERTDDIRLLAEYFIACAAARQKRPVPRLSESSIAFLKQHDWPGNVRELQNLMEVVVALEDDRVIEPPHITPHLQIATEAETLSLDGSFEQEVRAFKRRLIERTLLEHQNNKLQAAKSLGLARSSLHRLIDELHIESVRTRASKQFPIDTQTKYPN